MRPDVHMLAGLALARSRGDCVCWIRSPLPAFGSVRDYELLGVNGRR